MITPVEGARIAIRSLRLNLMRSVLTVLGIFVGVAAVILIVGIGDGAQHLMVQKIRSMGTNAIIVAPEASRDDGVTQGSGTLHTLTIADAGAITRDCRSVKAAAPIWGQDAQLVNGNRNWKSAVVGTTVHYFLAREWQIRSGRVFSHDEETAGSKVCLIGATVAEKLMGDNPPLGQVIRIQNMPCKVIGILKRKGRLPSGEDHDDSVFVPIKTAQSRLFGNSFPDQVQAILVEAKRTALIPRAEKEIGDLLARRHKIGPGKEKDFTVTSVKELQETTREAMSIFTALLSAITSISLVVGGIGIMNIMLVSVTERTREVGIRMAVGARPVDIMSQFLIEAVALSLMGGLSGLIAGIGGNYVLSHILDWTAVTSPTAIAVGLACSIAVGVCFGFYPAFKASQLKPIEALRYE
jgi:putative ABC transport system permease protein